ncbi:MAG: type VI secretion system tip protein TssI/VgrG, partial [Gemmatimonadota bacterium]
GAQTAVVVGKKGEEIFTDKQGRVKVQFHWDREGKKDEKSSCWVRVSSSWAGKGWGAVHLPRIGQEVVVSFLDGDPDRPLVTGSVYNAEQTPPFTLPGDQTQSGLRTRSSKKGDTKTFNELRFEDLKDKEEIFLHAERDLVIEVENDEKDTVDGARIVVVKGKQKDSTPKVSDSLKLEKGNQEITLDEGDRTLSVKKGDLSVKVAQGDQSVDLDKGSQTLTIFKDQKVTLKTGNQTTDVKAGKITGYEGRDHQRRDGQGPGNGDGRDQVAHDHGEGRRRADPEGRHDDDQLEEARWLRQVGYEHLRDASGIGEGVVDRM